MCEAQEMLVGAADEALDNSWQESGQCRLRVGRRPWRGLLGR